MYAVFFRNDNGELEQLTNWISFYEANKLYEDEKYHGEYEKVLLLKVR